MKNKLLLSFLLFFILASTSVVPAIQEINNTDITGNSTLENSKVEIVEEKKITTFSNNSQTQILLLNENSIIPTGKTKVKTNENFNPIYVKDFIKLNPEIEVISFLRNDESIGYINLFGGIGENFIINSNTEYEISTKKEIQIIR